MVEKVLFLKLKVSLFFFQNWKTNLSKEFVIYVIDFDPIRIYTCLALQNDHQNLNFVKDICVVGKTMARNGCKMAKPKSCHFFSKQILILKCLFGLFNFFQKQVDLRYHCSKFEFVRSFFGRNVGLKKSFRLCLTFRMQSKTGNAECSLLNMNNK